MVIVYSFNKRKFEGDYWQREVQRASSDKYTFIPFNHEPYLDPKRYIRAQLLDNLYYERHPGLLKLYSDFERLLRDCRADALIVDNCNPYHPDYLRRIGVYKALRIADGPMSAYDRDLAYLHAFDHVLYHSPAYSRDMGMEEKLRYCGARKADFWPLGSFDALCDPTKTEENILAANRHIDVIFIGALHLNKMPLLAKVKKALGKRFVLRGLAGIKKNIYFNFKYGMPGWVSPVNFESYVRLYQRTKIGINVHNRGEYTVGGYRFFDLPANGVMQISDGGPYLREFFSVNEEIIPYLNADDLIDKVQYYLEHDEERERIALSGFRRVRKDYRLADLLERAGILIEDGAKSKGLRKPGFMELPVAFNEKSRRLMDNGKG
jgi:spore maturation protein CgeB